MVRRPALVSLTTELFPDIDPRHPPQCLDDWIDHYAHGDEGALRLHALLGALSRRGYEEARRKRLHERFRSGYPGISPDLIDKFLYRKRLSVEGRALIVRHLWEHGLLPEQAPVLTAEDILAQAHRGLAALLDLADGDCTRSEARLAGRFWIYRASAHEPGQYVKGLLTVQARATAASAALAVTEHYRIPGDADGGQHELTQDYTGLVIEQSYRPLLLSCRRQDGQVTCLRVTSIAETQENGAGRVTSMRGVATASYRGGRFIAAPVCFERIPESYRGEPEEALRTLSGQELPPAILRRLSTLGLAIQL